LIEVPLGTVLLEEIAFRAVLFSMLARRYGLIWAVVISQLQPWLVATVRPTGLPNRQVCFAAVS
jgi:hypothetical protein